MPLYHCKGQLKTNAVHGVKRAMETNSRAKPVESLETCQQILSSGPLIQVQGDLVTQKPLHEVGRTLKATWGKPILESVPSSCFSKWSQDRQQEGGLLAAQPVVVASPSSGTWFWTPMSFPLRSEIGVIGVDMPQSDELCALWYTSGHKRIIPKV